MECLTRAISLWFSLPRAQRRLLLNTATERTLLVTEMTEEMTAGTLELLPEETRGTTGGEEDQTLVLRVLAEMINSLEGRNSLLLVSPYRRNNDSKKRSPSRDRSRDR